MINVNELTCPSCNGQLKYYDRVKRFIKTKGGKSEELYLRRLQCIQCGMLHRELPDNVAPYKQYDLDIIRGVLEGFITSEVLGFEDYPSEMTMFRWRTQKTQALLWKL